MQKRVREMGLQISKDFKGQRVHLIGVLKGAAIFLSDLIRQIRIDVSLDFMAVSSYGKGSHTSGQVRLIKDLDTSIEGLNVILVEDILDTGLTLGYLLRVLQQRKPKSLRIAALLDKPERRMSVRNIFRQAPSRAPTRFGGLQVADAPLARQSSAANGKPALLRRRVEPAPV